MSIGGENKTATTSSFKSVGTCGRSYRKETAVSGHVSHTHIHTKNGIVWTTARHRAECRPYVYLEKILINCWRLSSRINKDGTANMRKQRNEKKWENGSSTKKVEKAKKSWKGPASNRRRRCSGGNLWEAREVPTEHAQKKDLSMFIRLPHHFRKIG